MAFARIYYDGTDVERQSLLGWTDTAYSIVDGVLTIDLRGKSLSANVKPGGLYSLGDLNRKGMPIILMLEPHTNRDALMWLLDYSNRARYRDKTSFDLAVKAWREKHPDNAVMWCEGDGYGFAVGERNGRVGLYPLVAYIDYQCVIDKKLVEEILRNWRWGMFYPKPYVKKILSERFGFTPEEAESALRDMEFFAA